MCLASMLASPISLCYRPSTRACPSHNVHHPHGQTFPRRHPQLMRHTHDCHSLLRVSLLRLPSRSSEAQSTASLHAYMPCPAPPAKLMMQSGGRMPPGNLPSISLHCFAVRPPRRRPHCSWHVTWRRRRCHRTHHSLRLPPASRKRARTRQTFRKLV